MADIPSTAAYIHMARWEQAQYAYIKLCRHEDGAPWTTPGSPLADCQACLAAYRHEEPQQKGQQ